LSKSRYRESELQVGPVLETCLYVDDLDAAEDFYSRVLGLKVVSREGDRHVFFRCGEAMFLIFNPDKTIDPANDVPAHGARGPGHVAFRVSIPEMQRWKAHLELQGIQIEQGMEWPGGGQSLYFRDPSGNSVELVSPEVWGLPQKEIS